MRITITPPSTAGTRLAMLLAVACLLFRVSAAEPTRTNGASIADKERELERQIDRYVTYPLLERAHRMDGEVLVSFVIDTRGKVKVISARSANTDLCEYVLRMLAKVDIGDNPDGLWKTTHMRFNFRPEV